jgi:hypothetical protein
MKMKMRMKILREMEKVVLVVHSRRMAAIETTRQMMKKMTQLV